MDTELARTFLEIVATGSFIRAAERLNVGQTTVSARIRTLEQKLGRALFVRNKGGASLTPAGEQFLRYAPTFLQVWERARHQVAVPPGHRSVLAVGGEVSLWHPLVLDWVLWMRRSLPEVALRVHVDVPQDLINQVAAGLVDVAVMYAPPHRPGLKIDLLLEETLVLVTTNSRPSGAGAGEYVSVDWGPDFARDYAASFPEAVSPGVSVNLGPLALNYVLSAGGSGYFRRSAVQPYIASGHLHLVPRMPHFSYPIYAVYSSSSDDPALNAALDGLRAASNEHLASPLEMKMGSPLQTIELKRVYEPAAAGDGTRVLVDRLWPRGLSKQAAQIHLWVKDVAPSTELRKWFGHDPKRWSEFRKRYAAELRRHGPQLDELRAAARRGRITLVYAAHDKLHNHAVALREVLLNF
jgi:DNA-binding transcriptional LysR family regulator/uncharacterized protein YeaO (DUF488 family)